MLRRAALLPLVLILSATLQAQTFERRMTFTCRGLEAYEIGAMVDVDFGTGTIRSKSEPEFVVAFSFGIVAAAVPAQRPPGFRTFDVEKVGGTTLRYGLNVPQRRMHATLTGAPLHPPLLNLYGQSQDAKRFVMLARQLAIAPCKRTSSSR
jgi:hypothetical protein